MFLRTLLFFVVMYFLVKLISRLFLSSSNGRQKKNGASFIFRTFQRMAENQRKQQQKQNRKSQTGNSSERFEEIEEAEYEEITEEEKSTSTSSD